MQDHTRDVIMFSLVIVLAVFQVITLAVLIVMCKIFCSLKKNVEKYKDSLPLVTINTCTAAPTNTKTTTPSTTRCLTGTKQKAEINEEITRAPTPTPDRRSTNLERQSLSVASSTVAMTTKRTISTIENPRGVSFTSFNALSRDSGIYRDHGSLSSATSESLKEDNRKPHARDSNGSSVFAEAGGFLQEERSASNASRGSNTAQRSRASSRDQTKPITSHQEIRNDEPFHSRLFTMPIEQIDVTSSTGDEKRYKRASRILNQMAEEPQQIELTNNEISFVNIGYHGNDKTRAPLASEESSCGLSSDIEQVDENGNGVMGEVYVNQEIIDQERWKK